MRSPGSRSQPHPAAYPNEKVCAPVSGQRWISSYAGASQAERYETAETKIRGLLPKTAGVVPLPENESRGAHTSDMSAFLMTALRSDIFDYLLSIYVLCSSVRKRELCLDASSSEFESVRQKVPWCVQVREH